MLPSLRSPRINSHPIDQDARRLRASRFADVAASDPNRIPPAASSASSAVANNHHDSHSTRTPPEHPLSSAHLPKKEQHHRQQQQQLPDSSSTTTTTSTTTDDQPDRVFTPPVSDGTAQSRANGRLDRDSSQESQLLALSQLAAAQDKMPDHVDTTTAAAAAAAPPPAGSRKRMADGAVKQQQQHARAPSSASPTFAGGGGGGHSRNTSTVSVASTAGSRIGELSSELRSKLSYAMLKVNHGWQYHSIDQVESFASQAASPTSTGSAAMPPGARRHRASASPRLALASPRSSSSSSTPPSATYARFPNLHHHHHHHAVPNTSTILPSLAPPASIEPSRYTRRRNSNPRYTPTFLSHHASPHTPAADASSAQSTPHLGHRHAGSPDPILFSPHQNVREQDAIESLLFMSSPGNSASMKHTFPTSSSSQPLLPTTRSNGVVSNSPRPRKTLPSGRPGGGHQHSASQPAVALRRVGFERAGSDMDVDSADGSAHATPRQAGGGANGATAWASFGEASSATPRPKLPLSLPVGDSTRAPWRRPVDDEDVERMLDRVAAAAAVGADDGSSDSEGEIEIPVRREGGLSGF